MQVHTLELLAKKIVQEKSYLYLLPIIEEREDKEGK